MLLLLLQISYTYSHSLQERFKYTLNKHGELNFYQSFYPFTSLRMHGFSIRVWHRLLHIEVIQFCDSVSHCLVYPNS